MGHRSDPWDIEATHPTGQGKTENLLGAKIIPKNLLANFRINFIHFAQIIFIKNFRINNVQ